MRNPTPVPPFPPTGEFVPASPLTLSGLTHPSAILRAPDEAARREAYRALVADLRIVAEALRSRPARHRRPAVSPVRQRQLPLLP